MRSKGCYTVLLAGLVFALSLSSVTGEDNPDLPEDDSGESTVVSSNDIEKLIDSEELDKSSSADDNEKDDGVNEGSRQSGGSRKKRSAGGTQAPNGKSVQQIIEDAWSEADTRKTIDSRQKNHYFTTHMDKVFVKADSCEACMALKHKSANPEVTDEQKSEQFLVARSIVGDQVDFKIRLNRVKWISAAKDNKVCPENTAKSPKCNKSAKYRSIDGSCNNLKRRSFGKAGTAQKRFFDSDFDDGVGKPRETDSSNNPLPNARDISNILSKNQGGSDTRNDPENTVAVPAWGQFIDHDVTLTPTPTGENGSVIKCCDIDKPFGDRRQCFPIDIPANDQRFRGMKRCMEFKRSTPIVTDKCSPHSIREVRNDITAFIDASNVYGSNDEEAQKLRLGAKMNTTIINKRQHLPQGPDNSCNITVPKDICKKAGDERANEVPHLTMFHTCFVREHNRIVDVLQSLNKDWNNETLYQEARKIVGAILQHITYTEFLPIIIDEKLLNRYNLTDEDKHRYKPSLDPGIRTEFSTAAFRFGHSLVQSNQQCLNKRFKSFENRPLHSQFFDPHLPQNCLEGVARWTSAGTCKRMDNGFVQGVKDFLFLDKKGMSFDLVALNIQRGRDHGIPSYTTVRCSYKDIFCPKSFDDLKKIMSKRNMRKMKQAYRKVEDIDLFVGGVSEEPFGTGLVGETFGRILGQQFFALKNGDRFWYETTDKKVGFTEDQIKAIKRVKLSDIMCDCFNLDKLQSNVFKKKSPGNPREGCTKWATDCSLIAWKD